METGDPPQTKTLLYIPVFTYMHAYSRILHMMVWQQTGMEWNCYGPVPYTHVGVAVVSTMVGR